MNKNYTPQEMQQIQAVFGSAMPVDEKCTKLKALTEHVHNAVKNSLKDRVPTEAEMEALSFGGERQWQAWQFYRQQRDAGLDHDAAVRKCCWWSE